jgi:hypothetical protein
MNNNDEIYENDVIMEDLKFNQVCKQKKVILYMKGKLKIFLKNCIVKEENEDMIIKMHYVGHFIM